MLSIIDIDAEIDAKLPTNEMALIPAKDVRAVLKDILHNEQVTAAQIITSGGTPLPTSFLAGDNTWKSVTGAGIGGVSSANFINTRDLAMFTTFPATGSGGPSWLIAAGLHAVSDTPCLNFYIRQASAPASPFPASGYFQSLDGSYWVLQPKNGEYWVEQFGARPSANTNDTTPDNWQAFEDCKYAILLRLTGNQSDGIKMRIGPGVFFLSKSHSIEGGNYDIEGSGFGASGTFIRTPWNFDTFQVQFSFGGDNKTFGHEGFPFATNSDIKVGFLVCVSGTTRVYKCTVAGHTSSTPPSGTGTGIISGTATFDYVRERTWSEMRVGAADFSSISNLVCYGMFNNVDTAHWDEDLTAVDGGYHSGIVMKARTNVYDVFALSYPGFGFACCASGDTLIRTAGNVDYWSLRRCQAYYNGHAGFRNGVGISNAGCGSELDCAYNGWAGIDDRCFLSNVWNSVQIAYDGSSLSVAANIPSLPSHFVQGVTHLGYVYIARAPTVGFDPLANYANAPDTDQNSWIRAFGNGHNTPSTAFPTWSAANVAQYTPMGGCITDNANSGVTFVGLYMEGGTPAALFAPQTTVWGGALSNTGVEASRAAQAYHTGAFHNRIQTRVSHADDIGYPNPLTDDGGRLFTAYVGASARNGSTYSDARAWGFSDWEGHEYYLAVFGTNTKRTLNIDYRLVASSNEAYTIWGWSGQNTTVKHGRATTQPDTYYINKLALGDGGGNMYSNSNITIRGGSAPGAVSGEKNGDTIINDNPINPGDPWGWQVRSGVWVALNP